MYIYIHIYAFYAFCAFYARWFTFHNRGALQKVWCVADTHARPQTASRGRMRFFRGEKTMWAKRKFPGKDDSVGESLHNQNSLLAFPYAHIGKHSWPSHTYSWFWRLKSENGPVSVYLCHLCCHAQQANTQVPHNVHVRHTDGHVCHSSACSTCSCRQIQPCAMIHVCVYYEVFLNR